MYCTSLWLIVDSMLLLVYGARFDEFWVCFALYFEVLMVLGPYHHSTSNGGALDSIQLEIWCLLELFTPSSELVQSLPS